MSKSSQPRAWLAAPTLVAALGVAAAAPQNPAPVMEAVDDAQAAILASDVLKSFCAGAAELHALGPAFVIEPGARPQASPVARLQAARGAHVTNMRHEMVGIDDADRRLLSLLDGSLDRAAIAAQAFPRQRPKSPSEALDDALARLARQALLVQ